MSDLREQSVYQSVADAFAEHRDVLAGYIARKILRSDEVEDLLQETFCQAYQAQGDRPMQSPKGYLFIVARNLVSRSFSRQSKHITRVIDEAQLENVPSPEVPADEQLHSKIEMTLFMEAVESLPPRSKSVFLRCKVHGATQAQIAKELGISTSTVERDIALALTRLSSIMRKKGYRNTASSGGAQTAREQSTETSRG